MRAPTIKMASCARNRLAWWLVDKTLDHIASKDFAGHLRNNYLTGLLTTSKLSQMHRDLYEELTQTDAWA